jgi:sarcosine oxidase subunit beta
LKSIRQRTGWKWRESPFEEVVNRILALVLLIRLKSRYSVAIIGGGVIGCSIAYHLSEDYGEKVVVLEKDFIASGSSGLSAGILSQQLWDGMNVELVRKSIEWIAKKSDEEEGLELHRNGLLKVVCTEEEAESLKRNVDLQSSRGCDIEYLEPNEIANITPEISSEDVQGAAYCPDDSYVDPYQLCVSFARNAEEKGARFYQKSRVERIEREDDIFRLITQNDSFESDTVIISSGPWSKKVARMLGVDLPLKPYRTQVAITTPFMEDVSIPMVHDVTNDIYMKPETGGSILAGDGTETTESDPDDFKEGTDFEFMTSISEKMLRRLPRSKKASLVRGWSGLCTATPDRHPLIGYHSKVEGLFLAVGFNALGVMRAPAMGEIVSTMIANKCREEYITRFDPNRFETTEDFEIIQGFTL